MVERIKNKAIINMRLSGLPLGEKSHDRKLPGGVTITHVDIRSAGSIREIDLGDQVRIRGTMRGKKLDENVSVKKFLTAQKYSMYGATPNQRFQFLKGRVHADLYETKTSKFDVGLTSGYLHPNPTLQPIKFKTQLAHELRIDDSKTIKSGNRLSAKTREFVELGEAEDMYKAIRREGERSRNMYRPQLDPKNVLKPLEHYTRKSAK